MRYPTQQQLLQVLLSLHEMYEAEQWPAQKKSIAGAYRGIAREMNIADRSLQLKPQIKFHSENLKKLPELKDIQAKNTF